MGESGEIEPAPPRAFARAIPENAAYVVYTSGSTGRPKSVVIPHRGVVNHLAWMQSHFPMAQGDRALQMSAVSFDASVWELFGPLAYGATTVLAAPRGQREPVYLTQTLSKRRITHIEIIPSMLRVVMTTPGFEACTALRYVMSMAEGLPRSLARAFAGRHGAKLVNTYGPSECSIDTSSFVWEGEGGPARQRE